MGLQVNSTLAAVKNIICAAFKINSPKSNVGGPYVVVYESLEERWAVVALDWDNEPRLGIRWFWGNGGNPFSSSYPIWLIIPPSLSKNILSGLPLPHKFSGQLEEFLTGKISGQDLKKFQNEDNPL